MINQKWWLIDHSLWPSPLAVRARILLNLRLWHHNFKCHSFGIADSGFELDFRFMTKSLHATTQSSGISVKPDLCALKIVCYFKLTSAFGIVSDLALRVRNIGLIPWVHQLISHRFFPKIHQVSLPSDDKISAYGCSSEQVLPVLIRWLKHVLISIE